MKQKSTLFCLLVLLLALMIQGVQAQSVTANVTNNLNLRATASTRGEIVATMLAGTPVTLDGRTADSVWVHGTSAAGATGWMSASFLDIGPGIIITLPVLDPNTAPAGAGAAPAPTAAPADPAAPAAPAAVAPGGLTATATSGVNLRGGPGTSFAKVALIRARAVVTVSGKDVTGAWLSVTTAAGQSGWASARYFRGVDVAALPVVDGNTAVAAAPAAAGSNPPPVINNAPPVRGFDYGGHVFGMSDLATDAMRQAGMTWVKRQIRYSQGQDPNAVAGTINEGKARGFRVMLSVVGQRDQINNGNYFNDFAGYLGGLAALGADAIEVWNEPNIDREWPAGQISPSMYTQMLAASYNAIKSRNPGTLVISGAPAPTGFFGGCHGGGCDDAPFMNGMAAAGAANYMDCIGIHYNEGILPPNVSSGDPRGEYFTRYFVPMMDTYYNAFRGARPLCFTEIGYLTPEGFGPLPGGFAWAGGTTVANQAQWLDQALSMAAGSGKVRLFIVWNIDATGYGDDPQAGYAIIRPGGGCPACAAMGS